MSEPGRIQQTLDLAGIQIPETAWAELEPFVTGNKVLD
jgi:hypothetical protein